MIPKHAAAPAHNRFVWDAAFRSAFEVCVVSSVPGSVVEISCAGAFPSRFCSNQFEEPAAMQLLLERKPADYTHVKVGNPTGRC